MYLKELKAYKTPPVKANDAEGQVQKFSMPKPPTSPEEADIANDLKAYEDQVPEVEGQAVAGSAGAPEEDWFEDPEDEADAPSETPYHSTTTPHAPEMSSPLVAALAPQHPSSPTYTHPPKPPYPPHTQANLPHSTAGMYDNLDVDNDTLDVLDFGEVEDDITLYEWFVVFLLTILLVGCSLGVVEEVEKAKAKGWAAGVYGAALSIHRE
ncbi:ATP synthase F0 subcomplex subunit H atp14 [Friedmanniomyces endolithicus]|nr:ATP synthase F0 subcomplex subunit H atp14 [Friedmanniomyces endolithicus]